MLGMNLKNLKKIMNKKIKNKEKKKYYYVHYIRECVLCGANYGTHKERIYGEKPENK